MAEPAAPPSLGVTAVVHRTATTGDTDVAAALGALEAAGAAVGAPRSVDFTVTQSNVRYFYPEDAAAARTLADAIGAVPRDFTFYDGALPPGTVEVWLAGDAPEAVAAAPADPVPADPAPAVVQQPRRSTAASRPAPAQPAGPTARERELRDLKNRIILRLRRGDHL